MENKFYLDLNAIGDRIKEARKKTGLTQEVISEKICISNQFWSKLETGRSLASIESYLNITKALGISLNDLFYDETERLLYTDDNVDGILSDCDDFERAILLDFLNAMKLILKKRKPMIFG